MAAFQDAVFRPTHPRGWQANGGKQVSISLHMPCRQPLPTRILLPAGEHALRGRRPRLGGRVGGVLLGFLPDRQYSATDFWRSGAGVRCKRFHPSSSMFLRCSRRATLFPSRFVIDAQYSATYFWASMSQVRDTRSLVRCRHVPPSVLSKHCGLFPPVFLSFWEGRQRSAHADRSIHRRAKASAHTLAFDYAGHRPT